MKHIFSLTLFICFCICLQAQTTADIIIKNGRILDGTGNSWIKGDIAIKDGKILKTGHFDNISAAKIIDAKGLVVAPGFIDVHTHIEGDEFQNPTANNFILDGVTTVVTGNCGSSRVNIKKYLGSAGFFKTFHQRGYTHRP